MKKLIILLLPFVILSCGSSNNLDEFFIESTEFPYIIDSSFISTVGNSSTYKNLHVEYLKMLYKDVNNKNNLEEYYDFYLIKNLTDHMDTLLSNGVEKKDLYEHSVEFSNANIKALNKVDLGGGVVAYSWYFYEIVDPNQGADNIFITVFKDNKPISCFLAGYYGYYSDSPAWEEALTTSELQQDGKVYVNHFSREGEITDEEGIVIFNATHFRTNFSILSGGISNMKTDSISSYTKKEEKAEMIEPIPLEEFTNKFGKKELPANLDSLFISNISSGNYKKLSAGEAKTLAPKVFVLGNTRSSMWTVKEFIAIDSLKQIGKYEEYLQNIDMSMTETSEAWALNKYNLNNETTIFTWAITDATSEMGPSASGTAIFATVVQKTNTLECFTVAQLREGGDAPVWGETKIECKITDSGEFQIAFQYLSGDDDEGTVDKSNEVYNYQWKDGQMEKLPDIN